MKRKQVVIGSEHEDRELQARHRLINAMLAYACERIATPDESIEVTLLDEDELQQIGDLINASDVVGFIIRHPDVAAFCKKHHMRIEEPGFPGLGSRLVIRHILFPLPVSIK